MHPIVLGLVADALEGIIELPQETLYHLLFLLGAPLWVTPFAWWFLAGLAGVWLYCVMAEGPATPFGCREEKEAFWLISLSGVVGLAVAICSIGYVRWHGRTTISAPVKVQPTRFFWSRFK